MLRYAMPFVIAVLFLGGCGEQGSDAPAQPAPVAADAGQASKAFDAAADQLSRSYYQQVPEAATYNGITEGLTSGADARLNDRSLAGVLMRVADVEKQLVALKAVPTGSLSDEQRRIRDTLVNQFDGALGPSRLVDYASSFDVYGI